MENNDVYAKALGAAGKRCHRKYGAARLAFLSEYCINETIIPDSDATKEFTNDLRKADKDFASSYTVNPTNYDPYARYGFSVDAIVFVYKDVVLDDYKNATVYTEKLLEETIVDYKHSIMKEYLDYAFANNVLLKDIKRV